jgi:hypothetical protein
MMTDRPPNILFIISDDTDFRDIACYGGQTLTPHIDRLAREGMVFRQAYCESSVCTPSRYYYLTGQFAGHCTDPGFRGENPLDEPYRVAWNTCINETIPTVASLLRAGGYRTGYAGKWHTGRPLRELPIPRFSPDDDLDDPAVDADQLYDLENDPHEQRNLAFGPDYAGVLQDMKRRLQAYLDRFEHPYDLDVPAIMQSDRYAELAAVARANSPPESISWYDPSEHDRT